MTYQPQVYGNETAECMWCGEVLVDGRLESGFTGEGPDWMTEDGDFGCGDAPETSEDGVGGHIPTVGSRTPEEIFRTGRALVELGQWMLTEDAVGQDRESYTDTQDRESYQTGLDKPGDNR